MPYAVITEPSQGNHIPSAPFLREKGRRLSRPEQITSGFPDRAAAPPALTEPSSASHSPRSGERTLAQATGAVA
jgi:hypothetical protein